MGRFCVYSLAAASLLILILQLSSFQTSEAKKLIKLKDLKKAKKYGYLLATQRKKFYAIPVPFPLPVIVKRQQIYTQVPVLPRYVQQPAHQQQYSPSSGSQYAYEAYDPYAAMSAPQYMSQSVEYQPAPFRYPRVKYPGGSLMSGYGAGSGGGGRGGYFASLASALGQAYPGVAQSGVAGNVVGKLLSGQAKVLPPSQFKSLLFSSKPPATGYKPTAAKEPEEQAEPEGKQAAKETSNNSTTTTSGADKPSASEAIYSTLQNPYEAYRRPHHQQHHLQHQPHQHHHQLALYRPPAGYYAPAAYPQLPAHAYPAYAYQPTRLVPALVANPLHYAAAQNVAELMEQQQQQALDQLAQTQASGSVTPEALSAEPSELGQMELMQPQETVESAARTLPVANSQQRLSKVREQTLKNYLIGQRLAELAAARQLGLLN